MDKSINLEQFRTTEYATSTPQLKDLHNHITPHYAARWRVIGALLGLSSGTLDIIKYDNDKARPCCDAMLEEWLEVDPSATWNKLLSVIQSPAVSSDQTTEKGVEAVSILSSRMAMMNVHVQDTVDEDTWPPDQPKEYTPLLLIQHQEQRTKEQDNEMAKLIQTGDIDLIATGELLCKRQKQESHKAIQHVLNTSTVTKEVAEILTPLERSDGLKFVLIEGAPGIGKSVLLKHIAFQWGQKVLLPKFKIVLLVCLRDPNMRYITSIGDLLQLFCEGGAKAKEISTACSDYLLANGGKETIFLFDGYDEFPEDLRKSSFIAKILNRRVLPHCGLVVSSRPHASVHLRKKASVRIDIVGFTEQERQRYIEQSVKGNPHQIKELTQYLHHHPTISNICFAPLNITILLFLYQLGIPLPNNSTELHHHFICQTICRHLAKCGHPLNNAIADLKTLPEPYKKIVKQLARLSLEALNDNKLVFTSEDIEAACPDILASPEAINGFGLLQAVQNFGLTGKTMTFNFLHLTIQEYLAAHYIITDFQQDEELHLLRDQFWSDLHANMFTIYVTLTKGQRSAFKKFLSGGDDKIAISNEFLCNQLKCFHLYHCFKEAEDYKMCKSIEDAAIFSKKEIKLRDTTLSATNLGCVSLFLTSSSHKHWVNLNFCASYIQDHGLHIIHNYLNHSNITITKLWLSKNGLTRISSSLISNVVLSCKVEVLYIGGNHTIGENKELYTMLTHPFSMLRVLGMHSTSLSAIAARTLFTAIKGNNKLEHLIINSNNITDDVTDDITMALTSTKSLKTLVMHSNPISGEAILSILQALTCNNTIRSIDVPSYPPAIEDRIRSIVQDINTKRRTQGIKKELRVSC